MIFSHQNARQVGFIKYCVYQCKIRGNLNYCFPSGQILLISPVTRRLGEKPHRQLQNVPASYSRRGVLLMRCSLTSEQPFQSSPFRRFSQRFFFFFSFLLPSLADSKVERVECYQPSCGPTAAQDCDTGRAAGVG